MNHKTEHKRHRCSQFQATAEIMAVHAVPRFPSLVCADDTKTLTRGHPSFLRLRWSYHKREHSNFPFYHQSLFLGFQYYFKMMLIRVSILTNAFEAAPSEELHPYIEGEGGRRNSDCHWQKWPVMLLDRSRHPTTDSSRAVRILYHSASLTHCSCWLVWPQAHKFPKWDMRIWVSGFWDSLPLKRSA